MKTRILVPALAFLLTAACAKDENTYTYFLVHVRLDETKYDQTRLPEIGGCSVKVNGTAGDWASFALNACPLGHTPYDVGTFEYATTKTKGTIRFAVTFKGASVTNVLAEGTSEDVEIVPGKTSELIEVVGIPTATTTTDAGTPATGTPDGGAD